MSDRANGWLLILGGLAIGLVLWLSPSRTAPPREVKAIIRMELSRRNGTVLALDRATSTAVLLINAVCIDGCPPPCWSAGNK